MRCWIYDKGLFGFCLTFRDGSIQRSHHVLHCRPSSLLPSSYNTIFCNVLDVFSFRYAIFIIVVVVRLLQKQQAATQAVTEEALLLSTIDSKSLAESTFDKLHKFAAAIISAPSPVPTATAAAALPTAASASAVPTLLSCKNCAYRWETGLGVVWIHGGFQAFVCLEAKSFIIPTSLGLLPATEADSLHHAVFIQMTEGPNKMFGVWTNDKATDEGGRSNGQICFWYGCKMLRIKLDEYLALLRFVKEERNNWETIMLLAI